LTILSNKQVRERLGNSIVIEPFDERNLNTSSYDVTLGEAYYIEHRPRWWWLFGRSPLYNIWDYDHVHRIWGDALAAVRADHVFRFRAWFWGGRFWPKGIRREDLVIMLPPKHTILAHTDEFIGGRASVYARLINSLEKGTADEELDPPSTTMMKARSSMGRNFLEVCKCAGYGDVGYTNRWTMEITNNSRFYRIPLVVRRRIAQIVFMETGELEGQEDYSATGKYQTTADMAELKRQWHPFMMLPRLDRDRDNPDRGE